MSWTAGAPAIDRLLKTGKLQQVTAVEAEAEHLLTQAETHLATAKKIADDDPAIAYDALYAAARKSLTALLIQQGLRPTTDGGHEVVIEAVEAQFGSTVGKILSPFRRLKRTRNQGDYQAVPLAPEDVTDDLPAAEALVDFAKKLRAELPVFVSDAARGR